MSDALKNVPDDSSDRPNIEMPSHLDGIAIQLHEMYKSLMRAGFNDKEALRLIGFAVSAGIMEPYFEEVPIGRISIEDEEDGYDDDDDGDYV